MKPTEIRHLLSLPESGARFFMKSESRRDDWWAGYDPPNGKLGSGGGTAHLLLQAWKDLAGEGVAFDDWLQASRKVMAHGGGLSRRLGAYATPGKPLIPMPALRWTRGQSPDQTLLDRQRAFLDGLERRVPSGIRLILSSGDVLLQQTQEDERPLPDADVLVFGLRAAPEEATGFGVFFTRPDSGGELAFALQKPSADAIRKQIGAHEFFVDTGLWMLSQRAVQVLMKQAGYDGASEAPLSFYDLYGQFSQGLGTNPVRPHPEVSPLTCAMVALPGLEFYHLGTGRQLIDSVWALQNTPARRAFPGAFGAHSDQITQNSRIEVALNPQENHTVWIENSHVSSQWRLRHGHLITGAPDNDWPLDLAPGVCLDFAPIGENGICVRPYHLDDAFSGPLDHESTRWLGRPVGQWLAARGMEWQDLGWSAEEMADLHKAPLFPVVEAEALDAPFIQWLMDETPAANPDHARRWLEGPRLSARAMAEATNLDRLEAQRERRRFDSLMTMYAHRNRSVFLKLDLEKVARTLADHTPHLKAPTETTLPPLTGEGVARLNHVHELMFHSRMACFRGDVDQQTHYAQGAFQALSQAIQETIAQAPVSPRLSVLSDQIVWARSPARIDLAGGWSDTPPFCHEFGGAVTNLAIDLNGQPPIQVFAKPAEHRKIIVRSVDLGTTETIETLEQLRAWAQPGSAFALARAALALAGFDPDRNASTGRANLKGLLEDFGAGIEISMLAAIPAGSGLGTSSILAATLLAALNELCGLGWGKAEIVRRTLVLEQMITTGGGWQDQVGGVFRGVKINRTTPGLEQSIESHWLPDFLFDEHANRSILLYYTGITRMAKGILQDIVRGMFLNQGRVLDRVHEIRDNAGAAARAIQRNDLDAVGRVVAESWRLNQALDAGTNPPAVQAILDPIADCLQGCKLAGAGGGGYMLLMAKDEEAGRRIQKRLKENPPNPRARFVDLTLSKTGLAVTKS